MAAPQDHFRGVALGITLLAASLLVSPAAPAALQAPGPERPPEAYWEALRAAGRGDTVRALALLRQVTREHPKLAEGWGRLGQLLAQKAGGVGTALEERLEAEQALRKALELEPDHPRYLTALGLLMRKQQIYLDARRLLNRAEKELREQPGSMEARERAELWHQLGLFREDVYLDDRNLISLGLNYLPVQTPECAELGQFCLNFTRPRRFNEILSHAPDLSRDAEDEWEDARDAFREALRADPTHSGAFRRLAIHLYDRGELKEMGWVCEAFVEAAPGDPWGYLLLGLWHYAAGRDSAAAAAFQEGLRKSPPAFADHLRDVESLLRPDQAEGYRDARPEGRRAAEELLWRRSDPLYLTGENERWLEHMARVVYADVMFEDPSEGPYGAATEPGIIYVRYGPPLRIWKVRRGSETASLMTPGGRWIFWNYSDSLPNFIFEKLLRWRHVSHGLSTYSKALEEESRKREPTTYRPTFAYVSLPLRVARFKGVTSPLEIDFYALVPAETLMSVRRDTVEAGLFLFAPTEHRTVLERRVRFAATTRPRPLTFQVPLEEGDSLFYSLEARPHTVRAAGVTRGSVAARPFPADRLSLSDLLLAERVEPLVEDPRGRRDFRIAVVRTDTVPLGLPFALYWEVYGLRPGADSLARYEVTLRVQGADEKGVLADILTFFGRALGLARREDLSLRWERTTPLTGDRSPEYVEVSLGARTPGRYRAIVEVRDLVSGETATTSYSFAWVEPEEKPR